MTKSRAIKVGLFLICGIVLFAAGLFMIGNREQLFAHHYDIYTEFANVDTIVSGAKIRVSGMDAGQVSNISIPKDPSGKFRLQLKVDDKFRDIIREDSVASIETEGMVGNKFVSIKKGTNDSPDCKAGCTLPSEEPVNIGNLMKKGGDLVQTAQNTITDIQHHVDTTIEHVDGTIVAMRGNVERIASNGAHITNTVNGLVAGVSQGHGTVGKLLTDGQMANNVSATIAQAKQASTNIEQATAKANDMVAEIQRRDLPDVHQTVANARDTTAEIKGAVTDFVKNGPLDQNTGETLKETIDDAHRATRNLASDTEAVKHNFFLRGFFHKRGFYNLTQFNPSEYASSEFVKRPAKRIWLSAGDLFTNSPVGTPQLTAQGRSAVDQAISQIADELPNNPIMIEGYADSGSSAQRYLAASQRAADVKQYLESRFHLNPDLLGTIALDDKPPKGAGMESWNGVCLTLVVSRD